jgi:hypothetical protein
MKTANEQLLTWVGLGRLAETLGALKAGADANARMDNGCSPLMLAAQRKGKHEIIRALLPVADANAVNLRGRTALMEAAAIGNAAGVELLAPVTDAMRFGNDGLNALMLAAKCGSAPCVAVLLPLCDANARERDPRARISSGYAALHFAAVGLHPECCRLIAASADVDAMDAQGDTALRLAIEWGRKSALATVRALREAGASFSVEKRRPSLLDLARAAGDEALVDAVSIGIAQTESREMLEAAGGLAAASGGRGAPRRQPARL